jgi:hypothetical protein
MATTKQKTILADVLAQVDTLSTQHDAYVQQFVTRANEELYSMLAEMMRVKEDIAASGCEEYLAQSLRKSLRERWEIKTQNNTTITALVVRHITRGNRQLVHTYAQVIDRATAAGITSDKLVDYIRQKGSIDAIRKKTVDAEQRRQQSEQEKAMKNNLARYLATQKGIARLAASDCEKKITAIASDCKFNVSLSAYIDGKEQVVASIYPSSSLVNFCLDLYKLACEAAAIEGNGGDFFGFCKANSLDMDIVHRWMRDNEITNSAEAQAILRSIQVLPDKQSAANNEYALSA